MKDLTIEDLKIILRWANDANILQPLSDNETYCWTKINNELIGKQYAAELLKEES